MSLDLTNEIDWCKSVIDLRFSQYFSADGKTFDREYMEFLTDFLSKKNLGAQISDDKTGILIV